MTRTDRSAEGGDAGDRGADAERVHLLGALVGHHGLEVVHVPHHRVVQRDPGAAEHGPRRCGRRRGPRARCRACRRTPAPGRASPASLSRPIWIAASDALLTAMHHLGQLLLRELEGRQRLAELRALERVGQRLLVARTRRADRAPEDAVAGLVEAAQRALEPPDLGEHRVARAAAGRRRTARR